MDAEYLPSIEINFLRILQFLLSFRRLQTTVPVLFSSFCFGAHALGGRSEQLIAGSSLFLFVRRARKINKNRFVVVRMRAYNLKKRGTKSLE